MSRCSRGEVKREAGAPHVIVRQFRRCPRNGKQVTSALNATAPRRGKASGPASPDAACEPGDRPAQVVRLQRAASSSRRCGGQRSSVAALFRRTADQSSKAPCHQSRVSVRSPVMLRKLFLHFSFLAAVSAQAQEAQLQPTIQVTATRVAETVDASLADVSVIARPDIDASHAQDLIELLRLQAGIDVVRGGGPGSQTSIFIRGTNSNHVLVLIDGVRVASANTGAFAFENLPLDAIERIEIVRGPRASYWGSDAIGGVIQIFTRKLAAPHIAASYGSYRDADGSIGIGQWSDAGGFSAQFGARHVGGFSATNAGICNGPDDPYCIFNPDDNGYHNHDVVAQGAYRLGAQTLSATVFRNDCLLYT